MGPGDTVGARLEARCGYSLRDLCVGAGEVVLFGSRAAGLHSEDSDVDVLCVGRGRSMRSRALDLLWIAPDHLASDAWRFSELAGHIARYGVWLSGHGAWRTEILSSPRAAERKAALVRRQLDALLPYHPRLARPYWLRNVATIRRHLMRYELLANGEPVPSTPVLDAQWASDPLHERSLRRAARAARCETLVDQLLKLDGGALA